ncbi:nucleotidyltransferase family protein [methane-oxidizing endosymbiont of Gigantopelta aegis]|uniref:nucleotidyltransferase family protein n=1 Tax=methane-oxidizing endosymbiont of Gigantopelta aegis TaxID=2794938 RepID=UPI0018DB087B|nr:nucleotidyltransferase family protein [methane-oxidizing endosymbiont of Gigantopelta aegis]
MAEHWRQSLIKPDVSLRQTIAVIDKTALQIALVVDDDNQLQGVVTDGDIRRALIKGLSLETRVDQVMNKHPRKVQIEDSVTTIKAIMQQNQLSQLPVVDRQGRVVGLKTLQSMFSRPTYNNPVFLLAGGLGSRLRPLTDHCPKPLLQIGGKPILETIIEQFVDAGFSQFFIAVHYLADQIKDYFGDGRQWGVNIHYIEEQEPMGTAGAIGLLPDDLPELPLLVMNGDILTQVDFPRLLAFHQQEQARATLCVRQFEYQIPYGVVSLERDKITGIVEKPIHSCFSSAGIYVLDQSLVNQIRQQKRIDMPVLLNQLIENDTKVALFPIHEYWLDIGREADFLRAKGEFAHIF